MGDRAMAEIKTEDGSIYFYTHWTGAYLVRDCEVALAKARPRQGDPYATRIVIDHLIMASGSRDSETGSAIMLTPNAEDEYNDNYPSVLVDLVDWFVKDLASRPRMGDENA